MKNIVLLLLLSTPARAADPDWSATATIPTGSDRANVYALPPAELADAVAAGRRIALWDYPVTVTGLLVPYRPVKDLLESHRSLVDRLIGDAAKMLTGIDTLDDLWARLGLKPYPAHDGDFGIPYPPQAGDGGPENRIGVTLMERQGATGFTFSCATCHLGQLFGRPILGLTNKTTHANDFFLMGQQQLGRVDPLLFRVVSGATAAETRMLRDTRAHLKWAVSRPPSALGLDTSLAQVGLSLARREADDAATMTESSAAHPRANILDTLVADSKPAVWWNVKYKTRWLSDGSVISGNPVHTNILWNEIGRSTDLTALDAWLRANQRPVRDLTAAVFATTAPRYTDFFPATTLDLGQAKRGKQLFDATCSACHGTYAKGWESGASDPFATTAVTYHAATPVIDVGTDPGRYEGMDGFARRLNELKISRSMGTVVTVQAGYVPPPLVGIWARWPYFHNNSAPSLCAVLTRGDDRPDFYYAGEAIDPAADYDAACNGFPVGEATPAAWRVPENLFDGSKPGLTHKGHDEGVFLDHGRELLSPQDKRDLIVYLKTL